MFRATLAEVFSSAQAVVVAFRNPLQDREATNTVYLAWGVKQQGKADGLADPVG
jgi:hypothetical protein